MEKDYFQTNLVERSFCKSVFTFNKPYSKTFICTTEINAYLIVTYLKTIFFSTGYQSVFLSFTCCGVRDWQIRHQRWSSPCVFLHFAISISSHTAHTFPRDKYCLGACANWETPRNNYGKINQVILLIKENAHNHHLLLHQASLTILCCKLKQPFEQATFAFIMWY